MPAGDTREEPVLLSKPLAKSRSRRRSALRVTGPPTPSPSNARPPALHAVCAVALILIVGVAVYTYIVQRVESLMGLFYLATLYCAIRALGAKAPARVLWTGASVLSCALGMATKEVMATASAKPTQSSIAWERPRRNTRRLSNTSRMTWRC